MKLPIIVSKISSNYFTNLDSPVYLLKISVPVTVKKLIL